MHSSGLSLQAVAGQAGQAGKGVRHHSQPRAAMDAQLASFPAANPPLVRGRPADVGRGLESVWAAGGRNSITNFFLIAHTCRLDGMGQW